MNKPTVFLPWHRWLRKLSPLIVACLALSHAEASRVRPVNVEEMTERAARIVTGRCTEVRTVADPVLGVELTEITLEVERSLKGEPAPRITFRTLGAASVDEPPLRGVVGMPRFRPGEKVILFLYAESRSGLTSPVGLGQGKFLVVKDKQGREVALNGAGNRVLFDRLSPQALSRVGNLAEDLRGREGISPEALIGIVESLLR
jgi:hypothetical protein